MKIIKLSALLLLMVLLLPAQRTFADEEQEGLDANGNPLPGYVWSVNAINSGSHATADSLAMAAEYAMNRGFYDQAIKLSQQAIMKDDNDCDVHMIYAQALTSKLRHQKAPKDPNLYMAAVREWLIVMRAERGDERGLTNSKGVGIPGLQRKYADEERAIPAMQAIRQLVGYLPGPKETDLKFLKRVAKQCEYSAKGVIISKKDGDKTPDADAKATAQDASKNHSAQSKSSGSM